MQENTFGNIRKEIFPIGHHTYKYTHTNKYDVYMYIIVKNRIQTHPF